MLHNYTDARSIQYLYGELEEIESTKFEKKLIRDIFFLEEFNLLSEAKNLLDKVFLNPHPTSIELIMEFSKEKSEMTAI